MTSFRKLKIGSHDDETIHESSKRLGQPALIGKGKEKIASTSTDKSFDGKEMLESTDTETTRTSRGRTHLDKLDRQRVQGIRKEFTKTEYSMEEIDEVRTELAECIQDHIYE